LQSIRFWPESCKTSSKTVGDLRRLELAALERQFGRYGLRLHELARGVDYSEVVSDRPTQSISAEDTFEHDVPLTETGSMILTRQPDAPVF